MRLKCAVSLILSICILVAGGFSAGYCQSDEEIDDMIRHGGYYLLDDKVDEAIAVFDKIIEIILKRKPKKEYAVVYYKRGRCYERKKNYSQAFSDYTEALKFDPSYLLSFYGRGEIYLNNGDFNHAIEEYIKVIQIDQKQPHAYNDLAIAHYKRGDYNETISYINKAVEQDPDMVNAYYNRALAHLGQKDYFLAMQDFGKELEIVPNAFLAKHYQLAVSNFFYKKYNDCWAEVHILEKAGEKINSEFLEDLKQSTER